MWLLVLFACTAEVPERYLIFDRVDGEHQLTPTPIPWLTDAQRLDGELGTGHTGGAPDSAALLKLGTDYAVSDLRGLWFDGQPLRITHSVTDGVASSLDEQGLVLWSFYHHLGAARDELAAHGHDLSAIFPLDGIDYQPVIPGGELQAFDNAAYAQGFRRFILYPDSIRQLPLAANTGVVRHELTHAWFELMGGDKIPPDPIVSGINEGFADTIAALSIDDPYFILSSAELSYRDQREPGATAKDALDNPDFYVLGMVYASMAWSFRQTLDDRWAVLDVWADVMEGWIEDAWQDAALHAADADPWKVSPNPQQLGERLLSATVALPAVDAAKRDALCAAFAARFKTTDVYDGVCL